MKKDKQSKLYQSLRLYISKRYNIRLGFTRGNSYTEWHRGKMQICLCKSRGQIKLYDIFHEIAHIVIADWKTTPFLGMSNLNEDDEEAIAVMVEAFARSKIQYNEQRAFGFTYHYCVRSTYKHITLDYDQCMAFSKRIYYTSIVQDILIYSTKIGL
jgi:hypothetical protein